jgi:hypothetical protein
MSAKFAWQACRFFSVISNIAEVGNCISVVQNFAAVEQEREVLGLQMLGLEGKAGVGRCKVAISYSATVLLLYFNVASSIISRCPELILMMSYNYFLDKFRIGLLALMHMASLYSENFGKIAGH